MHHTITQRTIMIHENGLTDKYPLRKKKLKKGLYTLMTVGYASISVNFLLNYPFEYRETPDMVQVQS